VEGEKVKNPRRGKKNWVKSPRANSEAAAGLLEHLRGDPQKPTGEE